MAREKRQLAVIDAETDPFAKGRIPEPFIWGFYDGEGPVRYFEAVGDLIQFCRGKRLLVYAHNGGRFDYHLGFLRLLEPYSPVTIINGRLARFSIGECEFRDSVNILPIQLRDFDKDEIDYSKLERSNRDRHMPEIKRYLAKDCTSLYTIVSKFRARYGDALTLAGAAMTTWRKMVKTPSVSNQDSDFFNTISPYYYGGRVQAFQRGIISKQFHVMDINSAYPFAMLSDHPFSRSYEVSDHVPVPRGPRTVDPQALYTVDCIAHGCFPYREGHRLRFPDDGEVRKYHVTGWELSAALATESVESIRITRRYNFPVIDNFSKYIRHFYEQKRRAAKGSPEYIFAKLMMNALYGKFGANPENYNAYGIVPVEHAEAAESDDALTIGRHTGGWCAAGILGPWALLRSDLDEGERFYYNCATAASITGYVRAHLWRSLCKIRRAQGTPLYCDTDSIAYIGCRSTLSESKRLGDWSHEGTFQRAAIAGKKLYAFTRGKEGACKTASKGVRLSAAEIEQVARGEPLEYESDVPTFSVNKPPILLKRRIRMTG